VKKLNREERKEREIARESQRHRLHAEVIANAFPILQGAVFPPDPARLLRDTTVGPQVFLRNG
jgi:hypothetical protein